MNTDNTDLKEMNENEPIKMRKLKDFSDGSKREKAVLSAV